MAVDYKALAATARRLISDNGRPVVLRMVVDSGIEWDPIQATVDVNTRAVQTSFDKEDNKSGWEIASGDVAFLLQPGVEPTLAHQLVDGSAVYKIISVRAVKPGPEVILYKVQARS